MKQALSGFHPLIQKWFTEHIGTPTDVQVNAWPDIAAGKNVLVTAPTGSGKTLTAFLWAVNQLATGVLKPGVTRVLYVSPLKALNNDIRRNLIEPLGQIRTLFEEQGVAFPKIRVLTRSGDTPAEDRRKMFRYPPEILITTPESLNLLLSSKSGIGMLGRLNTVILDEIHAVAGSKRGVHLITAVDRLVRLSGEFQRICLSATVKNRGEVARFVGGFKIKDRFQNMTYEAREVELIDSAATKNYKLNVKYPQEDEAEIEASVWDLMAKEFRDLVEKNRSTLFFTNGRRLCEKITFKINRLSGQPLAWSHHGSLSRQLRYTVEQNLKDGNLKAIVATSSLEMGIDIGNLDEVVMIQSPPSISSAVQRVGRAGHKVGMESRGTLYCAHPRDLIASAVLAKAIDKKDIEPVHPVFCPLDVLAQIVISMVCLETWDMDELYAFIRTSSPYHDLTRDQFDLVLNMLAGRYADTRIRELKPKISIDRTDNTVEGKKGALLTLYTNGGTIPDRGYFGLKNHESDARIGELDEEYVWEAKIGQIATMGTQNWKITNITHNDVFARPAGSSSMEAPFWIAEDLNRTFHFSDRILTFLEQAQDRLDQKTFKQELCRENHMDENAAKELIRFLKHQVEVTQCDLPHRHHILLEYVRSGPDGKSPGNMLVIHTLWGGRLNRPFAMAMEAAWEKEFGEVPEIFPGNDAIVIQLPHGVEPEEILALVPAAQMEDLVREKLEQTGFFSARFRECAGRALLVVRNRINQRMPLWMTRLKSKKLLENIIRYEDFPILLETWRTCLKDEFDLDRLFTLLQEIESGRTTWTTSHTSRPSPFAASMAWNQINQYMYKEDEGASAGSSLGNDLVQELVFSSNLRPQVEVSVVKAFEDKSRRLLPGYAPSSLRELVDWVIERIALPKNEWDVLIGEMKVEIPDVTEDPDDHLKKRLVFLDVPGTEHPLVVSREKLRKILDAWYPEHGTLLILDLAGNAIENREDFVKSGDEAFEEDAPMALLGQWLEFFGPLTPGFIGRTLGFQEKTLTSLLEDLEESRKIISGRLVKGGGRKEICDSENFEILLRMARARAVPGFEPLGIEKLPLFLAQYQGLIKKGSTVDDLFEILDPLTCIALPADAWESEILPARLQPYYPSFLDTLMQDSDLVWLGFEKKKTAFCFGGDLDLISLASQDEEGKKQDILDEIFDSPGARYDFTRLLDLTGLNSKDLAQKLWDKVWQTKISNETFSSLRKGIQTRFSVKNDPASLSKPRSGRRPGRVKKSFSQWKGTLPFSGHWYASTLPEKPDDLIALENLNRDRVRLLFDRYGILFKELLDREMPGFRWADIFRSLRLMELSGEIVSGCFFNDIPGLQFMSHKGFRKLAARMDEDAVYFFNAIDPASVCGLGIPGLKQKLPARIQSTHLVYHGSTLVFVSQKNGKALQFHCLPDDPHIVEYLAPLTHLLTRPLNPLTRIVVETINREKATQSSYLESFETVFNVVRDYKNVVLYRREDSFF